MEKNFIVEKNKQIVLFVPSSCSNPLKGGGVGLVKKSQDIKCFGMIWTLKHLNGVIDADQRMNTSKHYPIVYHKCYVCWWKARFLNECHYLINLNHVDKSSGFVWFVLSSQPAWRRHAGFITLLGSFIQWSTSLFNNQNLRILLGPVVCKFYVSVHPYIYRKLAIQTALNAFGIWCILEL